MGIFDRKKREPPAGRTPFTELGALGPRPAPGARRPDQRVRASARRRWPAAPLRRMRRADARSAGSQRPGAKAVICDGCGRQIDVCSAEIPCTSCGGSITLPSGVDQIACPYCQSQVTRAGIR
jgi:hypothetical protein